MSGLGWRTSKTERHGQPVTSELPALAPVILFGIISRLWRAPQGVLNVWLSVVPRG